MRILDTDHCIALLRGRLRLSDAVEPDELLATTAISVGELMHGAFRSSRQRFNVARVNALLAPLQILSYDEQSAYYFGKIKADLEKTGSRIGEAYLQISSIALRHNATVVTHNKRHFSRVEHLALDDWLTG